MQYPKLCAFLLLCLTLCGCDGGASYDTPGNPRPAANPINGTWRIRSITTPQTGSVQCPATTFLFTCDADSRYTFTGAGTFVDNNNNTRLYNLAGSSLTYTALPATTAIAVTFRDDLMEWNAVSGNDRATVLFQKQ